MKKMIGRLITTHKTRDNIYFSKEALQSVIKQINSGDKIMPFNINHNFNRQIGFVIPGSAKLIQLEDGEFAVEAEINIYETNEERLKFFVDVGQKQEKVVLDSLMISAIKMWDTNCPTYLLEKTIFSILNIKPNLDDEGLLMILNPSEIYAKGILIDNKHIVLFNHFLRRGFSEPNAYNKRLIDKLIDLKIHLPTIRLSFLIVPIAISFKSEFKDMIECDYAWGPKLPLDLSLLKEGVTKHLANEEDKSMENLIATDFWWKTKDINTMELQIEELRDKSTFLCKDGSKSKYFPLKYAHLQFDKVQKKIVHLDCAIRIYSEEEFDLRLGLNDMSKANKQSSKRIKLFKLDGIFEPKDAFDILSFFFINNSDVRNYLEAKK